MSLKILVEPNTLIAVVFKEAAFLPQMDPKTGQVMQMLNTMNGRYRPVEGEPEMFSLTSPSGDRPLRWYGHKSSVMMYANLEETVIA